MSSCPSVRARNSGSGYVKESESASSDAAKELAARLAERAAQDARIWGPAPSALPTPSVGTTATTPKTTQPKTTRTNK